MVTIKALLDDVDTPEGPVSTRDGGWYFTEMGRGCISYVSDDRQERRVVASTGRPNGLALDANGNLWVAESKYPSLQRIDPHGHVDVVLEGYPRQPVCWPNDLCFGPDGMIYLTDSGVLLESFEGVDPPEAAYEVPVNGKVLKVDPASGSFIEIDTGLQFANGIAFGPEGRHLYVSETLTGNIYRYAFADGQLGARELFGNVMKRIPQSYGRVAGPDGMAFDVAGNLYVAVLIEGTITVLGPTGDATSRIALPGNFPTNVAFSQIQPTRIVVTEAQSNLLLTFYVSVKGLPLFA